MRHCLTNIDEENLIGTCSICGKVPLSIRSSTVKGKSKWRCSVKNIQKDVKRRSKRQEISMIPEEWNCVLYKNRCEICGKTSIENKKALSVDHCHKTGKIRGVLCQNCNFAIGLLNDSVNLLNKAIVYLKEKE